MTEDDLERIAEKVAHRAVGKVFAVLGVDFDEPRQLEELRQTLRHAEMMRQLSSKSVMAVGISIAVGIAAATWTGIQAIFQGWAR